MDGLRTLVLGTRDLTEQEFNAWKAAHHNAAIAIGKNTAGQKIKKKVQAKKLVKSNKSIFFLKLQFWQF